MKKNFSLYSLAEREKKEVKAGVGICLCGCAWANCGGSSTMANSEANNHIGLVSRDIVPHEGF